MKRPIVFLMVFMLIGAFVFVTVPTASTMPSNIKVAISYTLYGTGSDPGTEDYDLFSYDGIYWYDGTHTDGIPVGGIQYYVDPRRSGVDASATIGAVKAAFETWDIEVTVELFADPIRWTERKPGSSSALKLDGENVVAWKRLRAGVVAMCIIWYYSDTLEIVEFGMVFNQLYAWDIDPDGEETVYSIDAFDIQNVATHEAGHTLSLNDLYMEDASELTMYGYTSIGETKKQSLGLGDRNGVDYIY